MNEKIPYQILGPNQQTSTRAVIRHGKLRHYSTEDLHVHPFHQILMIKNGVTLLEDENRRQPLFGNMTAFLPAGFPHRSVVIGKTVEYQTIYFAKKLFDGWLHQISIFDISELGISLFNRLDQLKQVGKSEGFAKDCLNLFLQVIKQDINHPSLTIRLPEPKVPHNRLITGYIENHYQEKIKLEQINKLVPRSPRQIARVFQNDLKITIFEYLKLYRIFIASTLLTDSDENITEIAYSCGYDSISCFYTDFSKLFSIPPNAFRKLISPVTQ